jgi:protein-tyrosine kinase
MSAEPSHRSLLDISDQDVADALVLLFKLPSEAIDSITVTAKSLGVGFPEAALHTGLVTAAELKETLEWLRRNNADGARPKRGIIEEMLHRESRKRDVVLWKGGPLVPGRDLVLAHDPDNPRCEALRSLRTELLMRIKNRPRAGVFALLSPSAGEGRSQVAAELAIAFAQLGRRTLLIDGDLRRPRQHTLFDADNAMGLAQVLSGEGEQLLHGVRGLPQMALLTSGGLPRNPVELLSGRRFEQAMTEWTRAFEFVILDTPPAGEFSDALAVATVAGNVIVLGRDKVTSFTALKRMCRALHTTQAHILGAVINAF